ncbi:hypothetical protein [Streptomyces sp. CA2R101]
MVDVPPAARPYLEGATAAREHGVNRCPAKAFGFGPEAVPRVPLVVT